VSLVTLGKEMNPKRISIIAIISAVAAGPIGGFFFGFMNCSDCGWNVFSRAFIGCVMAVLTPLYGGFPPQNEGGVGAPFNAWPHIAGAAVLTFGTLVYLEHRRSQKE
jgi:hypothetical protein